VNGVVFRVALWYMREGGRGRGRGSGSDGIGDDGIGDDGFTWDLGMGDVMRGVTLAMSR